MMARQARLRRALHPAATEGSARPETGDGGYFRKLAHATVKRRPWCVCG